MPVPNKADMEHYLPAAEAREYIESNNLSADDLKKYIPTKRAANEEKKMLAERQRN